ncbi:MAG: hypothetical protein JRD89_02885 [Deltaproteobacteria bacterium]|nr:hypothetical protein [Deltaproteobacteria bacterium]
MQREVKFRAWDKLEARMRWGLDNLWLGLGGHLFWQVGYNEPDMLSPRRASDIVLMQYTGLKDRNDKDIYEGDIVRGQRYTEESAENIMGYVVFQIGCFWLNMEGEPFPFIALHDVCDKEVIGNVCEHPELLEAHEDG